MKYDNANSLRTQQAVARYGKSARHPLCLAALDLWRLDEELSAGTKNVGLAEALVNSAKQLKNGMHAVIGQLRRQQKEKETNEASALLSKIDEHLKRATPSSSMTGSACLSASSTHTGWKSFLYSRDAGVLKRFLPSASVSCSSETGNQRLRTRQSGCEPATAQIDSMAVKQWKLFAE